VSHDGRTAFVADADRDQVYLVDLATGMVTTVPLQQGDEPGRLAEDAAGRVHVACRRAGVIVTIDVAGRSVVDRQPVCPSPRGMGYDPAADALYVACATGELVTLPAAGGAPTRTVAVDRDLRDVIVGASGALYVTRLKTAELLSLGQNGSVQTRRVPPTWSRAS
jgi:DNA-binding beta-propeller fold protein YncE